MPKRETFVCFRNLKTNLTRHYEIQLKLGIFYSIVDLLSSVII